jgi:hypothetical protein
MTLYLKTIQYATSGKELGCPDLFFRRVAQLNNKQHLTMAYLQLRRIAILLAFAAVCIYAEQHASSIASMSVPEIEEKLHVHATNRHGIGLADKG